MDDLFKQTPLVGPTAQILVADVFKDGVNVARMPIGIGTATMFRSLEGFSVPEGCTLSLRAFDDPIDAEKYVRGLK